MGSILNRALEQAGLGGVYQRVLGGAGLDGETLARLRTADVLLLAGLADAVRGHFHGDEVRVLSVEAALREPELRRLGVELRAGDKTGQELLALVALARLATPGKCSVGVALDQLGLQLAQVALSFGADVLFGEFGAARSLPLAEGPLARRSELGALIARAGRRVHFDEPRAPLPAPLPLESRS